MRSLLNTEVRREGRGSELDPCLALSVKEEQKSNTREVKSAPSSPSRSPTPCRFKHSHLASRVSQGEPG